MSDIAMLVAEEYERRVNLIRKASVDVVVGVSQDTIGEAQKMMMMKPKSESLKWAWEPKSKLGLAASANFFSA